MADTSGSPARVGTGIDLFWIPLGAGGHLVRLNGMIYERITAHRESRRPLDLYHCALDVNGPEGRFTIEQAWPIPDREGDSRGVLIEGPVFSHYLGRFRLFRYELRRWRDGVIPDAGYAVTGPQRVSDDADVGTAPPPSRRLRALGSFHASVYRHAITSMQYSAAATAARFIFGW